MSSPMDQDQAPVLDALDIVQRHPITGFGGPGHNMGQGVDDDIRALLGQRAFEADVLTPKGLDDRSESAQVMQRAWALAAEAWGGDLCRFGIGGSTQALQIAISALAGPGEPVLIARNAHRAEFNAAVLAGVDLRVLPVVVDRDLDIEHGVDPAVLAAQLEACPTAKAVVVVSPSFYGVTSDIPALATVCHARGVPLVVDSAWGAAHAFCSGLPEAATRQGADIVVSSVHKTMGALAQGSVSVVSGELVDPGRFILAYESFRTTSPSVPILASIDAARRHHVRDGERLWGEVLAQARQARRQLADIDGVAVRGREILGGAGAVDLDETKVVFSVKGLGITGFQADEWLQAERRVSVVLADMDHLLAVFGIGTQQADTDRLVDAVAALAAAARAGDERLGRPDQPVPSVADLDVEMAMPAAVAFRAPYEIVPLRESIGRIAAEIVGPSPPEVPRLVPGQRIGAVHVSYLLGCLAAGAYLPDPTNHGKDRIRVVRA